MILEECLTKLPKKEIVGTMLLSLLEKDVLMVELNTQLEIVDRLFSMYLIVYS